MDKFESKAMLCPIAGKRYAESKKITRREGKRKRIRLQFSVTIQAINVKSVSATEIV